MCVSFRPINAVTRPFVFPVPRCDDSIRDIGDRQYVLTLDLDSGYWQVNMHENSKDKTAFFTPDGKKHFNRLPMGIKNVHAFFTAMVLNFRTEWNDKYGTHGIPIITKLLVLYDTLSTDEVKARLDTILTPSPNLHIPPLSPRPQPQKPKNKRPSSDTQTDQSH